MSINASWLEISGDALRRNVKTFRDVLAAGTNLMVVVKANAYGHDLEIVSGEIADAADWFGVDSLDEAIAVEGVAPLKPILILGYSEAGSADTIVGRGFRQVVYRMDQAQALSRAATADGQAARVHLKIETGTNRQGVPMAEAAEFGRSVAALPGVEVEGIYTHFANIEDTLDPSYAELQLRRFRNAVKALDEVGIRPALIHGAATAGILLYPETHFTMVRLGIGAYGIWPSRETRIAARERGRAVALEPAMTWKTRIAQLKRIEPGEYVGYGLSFQASRPTTLAVIPVGYSEGYDRKLSGSGHALVRGKRVPVVGRVAMNMTMLDVTDAEPEPDDEVVLIGRQGEAEITADDIADRIGTISYEVLARINPLLERRVSPAKGVHP